MEDCFRIHLAALSNFDQPVARFDRDGVLTYLNHAGERLLGTPVTGEITLRGLFRDPDHYEEVVRQLSLRLRGEASDYEASFHRPHAQDGEPPIPVRIYAFPETNEAGEIAGSLALMRDLREERACQNIHHANETVNDNQALFQMLAAEIAKLIPYDEMRITTVNEGRTHLRMLYSSDLQATMKYPYRWWPMPAFIRATLQDYVSGIIDVDAMFASPAFQELLETDPHVMNYRAAGVKETQIFPIHQNSQVVAFVALDSLKKGGFDQETVDLLGRLPITEAVLAAMNREERVLRMTTLNLIHHMSTIAENVHQAAEELVTRLARVFGWDHVSVFQIEDDPPCVRLERQSSSVREYLPNGSTVDIAGPGVQLAGLLRVPETIVHLKTRAHSPFSGCKDFNTHGSQLIVPIRGRHTLWALNIECSLEEAFSNEEIAVLQQVADEAGEVLHRSSLYELQRAVLGAINDAVIETSRDGAIRWCNNAARQMLDIDPLHQRLTLAQLLPSADAAVAAGLAEADHFARRELTLQSASGASIPVLMSCSTLPKHLGGKVYVASDYTYQRELRRQGALKEVFRHAAMEGRIPLSLASTWLEQIKPQDQATRSTIDKVLRQMARADLPLERLLRLFSSPPEASAGMSADLNRAVAVTLAEFPENQAASIDVRPGAALIVSADFNHLQFCIESMLAFGLRTRPQNRTLHLSTGDDGHKAIVRVEGDWQLDSGIEPEVGSLERWRRKVLFDLTLGEAVLQHMAQRFGGKFRVDVKQHLALALELPLLDRGAP